MIGKPDGRVFVFARGGRFDREVERVNCPVGREPERRTMVRKMDDQDAPFDCADASGAELGVEAVGQVVPDGPGRHVSDSTE